MPEIPQIVGPPPMLNDPRALVELAFQRLINTKHLYQAVEINVREAYPEGMKPGQQPLLKSLLRGVELDLEKDWVLQDPGNLARTLAAVGSKLPGVYFGLRPVRSFCHVCDEFLPFSLNVAYPPGAITIGDNTQVFFIPLQCDGCKEASVVFLVKRDRLKIRLTGRSEFENLKSPTFVPKQLREYYSQAILAFSCGQTLPALFLLRTLIEQHMRSRTKKQDEPELRGDALGEEYAKLLDEDFRQRFPSLADVYGKLSDALHRAVPDIELFEHERERIERHLEGLAVFEKNPRKNA